MMTMRRSHAGLFATALAGALLSLPQCGWAAGPGAGSGSGAAAQAMNDSAATANAAARLNKKQFRKVKVTVENGIATLTGSVNLYKYKADAEKQVRHARGVDAVRNQIEVAGPNIPDNVLEAKLLAKLAVDREGYDVVFNAITVHVKDGVVTLGGHSRSFVASDSAVAMVSACPGVKGVVNHIAADPPSMVDDTTRLELARAIYGYPELNKYAFNPAKPIRILVQFGRVELYGTVDTKTDKEMAYMRAISVPGVLSVQNDLQVANQPSERQNERQR